MEAMAVDDDAAAARRIRLGMGLGVLAMALFGLTLPMTRLAIGTADHPQLSPWFVTSGRAVLAAVLSACFLVSTRSRLPARSQWTPLVVAALGNAVGYPLLLALALRHVTAGHAAVITASLPLMTAVVAAWMLRQRVRGGFWVCAVAGSGLVVLFSWLRVTGSGGAFTPAWADLLLVVAMLAASVGYVFGARVTPQLGAARVICWVTIIILPVSLPAAWLTRPQASVAPGAWVAFAYVGVFSMWAAFFAWYRALDLGGPVRVSQVQMLQPFFAMAFAVPLLGESLDAMTVAFAAAVIVTVIAGQRFHRAPPRAAAAPPSPERQSHAAPVRDPRCRR
jgi:drug/metabolite transporter (DMT)-like permease